MRHASQSEKSEQKALTHSDLASLVGHPKWPGIYRTDGNEGGAVVRTLAFLQSDACTATEMIPTIEMIPATEMIPNHHRNDPHHRNETYFPFANGRYHHW